MTPMFADAAELRLWLPGMMGFVLALITIVGILLVLRVSKFLRILIFCVALALWPLTAFALSDPDHRRNLPFAFLVATCALIPLMGSAIVYMLFRGPRSKPKITRR